MHVPMLPSRPHAATAQPYQTSGTQSCAPRQMRARASLVGTPRPRPRLRSEIGCRESRSKASLVARRQEAALTNRSGGALYVGGIDLEECKFLDLQDARSCRRVGVQKYP